MALGAKVVVSQSSAQYQNRMNRKMGISSINGVAKSENKKDTTHTTSNGIGKRKADMSSDSEEDSKTKLITKLSSKKPQNTDSLNKKSKSSTESKPHKTIAQSGQKSSIASPEKSVSPNLLVSMSSDPDGSSILSNPPQTTASPPLPLATTTAKHLELSISTEDRAAKESCGSPTKETPEEEKKRIKKEKKKERKRLKKLEKLEAAI